MKDSKVWIGLCAVVALSGCATGLLVVEGAGCGAVPDAWREGGCGGHGER